MCVQFEEIKRVLSKTGILILFCFMFQSNYKVSDKLIEQIVHVPRQDLNF